MGLSIIKSRGGDDEYRFKKALKKAVSALDEICELSEEMEDQYSERDGSHMRSGYSRREDWDEMDERRGRDSMGRYR